jgi:hypothetical protein
MGETIVNVFKKLVVVLAGCSAISSAVASDFDGSQSLICATVEARDCVLGGSCFTGHAREIGAPQFMRINFAKKTITGTERTTPIISLEQDEQQLLMQGTELGYGWTFAIDQTNGDFSAALTNINGSFLLFGSCTVD